MNVPIPDLAPAVAELFMLAAACAVLLADLFVRDARRWITLALTQCVLAACVVIVVVTAGSRPEFTFSMMFVDDPLADALELGDALLVAGERVAVFHLVEGGDAHLGDFFLVDQIHRAATGDGHLVAAGQQKGGEGEGGSGESGGGSHRERRGRGTAAERLIGFVGLASARHGQEVFRAGLI